MNKQTLMTALIAAICILFCGELSAMAQGLIGTPHCPRAAYFASEANRLIAEREMLCETITFVTALVLLIGVSFIRITGPKAEIKRLYLEGFVLLSVPPLVNFLVERYFDQGGL